MKDKIKKKLFTPQTTFCARELKVGHFLRRAEELLSFRIHSPFLRCERKLKYFPLGTASSGTGEYTNFNELKRNFHKKALNCFSSFLAMKVKLQKNRCK